MNRTYFKDEKVDVVIKRRQADESTGLSLWIHGNML